MLVNRNRIFNSIIVFILIIVLLLILFWPILFNERTMYPNDIISELFLPFASGKTGTEVQVTAISDFVLAYYPQRWFQAQSFKNGSLNLWNPYIYGGYPVFSSTGYLVSLDLFNLLLLMPNLPLALAWRTFMQLMACMLFMYLYLRYLNLNILACFIGSIAYSLNSMFWINIFDWSLGGMLWLPLVLLFIEKAIDHRSYKLSIFAGIILGLGLLASPLQIYFYLCFSIVAIIGLKWIILWRNHGYKVLGFFLISFFIGNILNTIQILPTLELLHLSTRLDTGFINASAKELRTPLQMVLATFGLSSFVFPNLLGRIKNSMMIAGGLFGGETHWQGFIGIVPFMLGFIGAVASKDKRRLPYLIIAILVIITVIYTPIVLLLYERFFIVYIFCAAVLAGLGCQAIIDNNLYVNRVRYAILIIVYFLVAVALLLIALNIALYYYGELITTRVESIISGRLSTNYLGASNIQLYYQKARYFLADLKLSNVNTFIPISIAAIGLFFIISMIKKGGKIYYGLLIITILTAFDMGFMTLTHVPLVDLRKHPFSPGSAVIDLIKKDKGLFRVLTYNDPQKKPVIPLSSISTYGIETILGYENLSIPNVGLLLNIGTEKGSDKSIVIPHGVDVTNVKYVITGAEIILPAPKYMLIYDHEVRLYLNRNVLPRAFWVEEYEVIPDWQNAIDRVKHKEFNASTTVVLEKIPRVIPKKGENKEVHIIIDDYRPTRLIMRVSTGNSGLLVVSNTYYPGWEAEVDGKPEKILRANGVMWCISLKPGNHIVTFRFQPILLKTGIIISLSTLLVSIISLIVLARYRIS